LAVGPDRAPGTFKVSIARSPAGLASAAVTIDIDALHAATSPWPRYELGRLLQKLGRCPEAAAQYRDAIRLAPGLAPAQAKLDETLRQITQATEPQAD
jgi:predicted RNA polymerase sigma factor